MEIIHKGLVTNKKKSLLVNFTNQTHSKKKIKFTQLEIGNNNAWRNLKHFVTYFYITVYTHYFKRIYLCFNKMSDRVISNIF